MDFTHEALGPRSSRHWKAPGPGPLAWLLEPRMTVGLLQKDSTHCVKESSYGHSRKAGDVEPLVSVWQGLHPFLCQGSSAGGEAASYGNLVDAQEPGAIGP